MIESSRRFGAAGSLAGVFAAVSKSPVTIKRARLIVTGDLETADGHLCLALAFGDVRRATRRRARRIRVVPRVPLGASTCPQIWACPRVRRARRRVNRDRERRRPWRRERPRPRIGDSRASRRARVEARRHVTTSPFACVCSHRAPAKTQKMSVPVQNVKTSRSRVDGSAEWLCTSIEGSSPFNLDSLTCENKVYLHRHRTRMRKKREKKEAHARRRSIISSSVITVDLSGNVDKNM